MATYKLVLEYVGTRYAGWQVQPGQPTVQGEVLDRVRRLLDEPELLVAGAARTDAGVHAHGQIASFTSEKDWDPAKLRGAMNGILPDDIGVLEASIAPDGFHARRSATGRIYRYQFATGPYLSPFMAPFAFHYRPDLDVAAMGEAAAHLLGEHDFSSFRASADTSLSPVKTLRRSEVRREGSLILYEVEGSSFLQHMVRSIAGSLLDVGRGHRTASWIADALRVRSRDAAGPTLPARGLFLEQVLY